MSPKSCFHIGLRFIPAVLLILTFNLVTSPAWGSDPNLDWVRADSIYKETYQLCKNHPEIVPEDLITTPLFLNVMEQSASEAFSAASFDPDSILQMYIDKGLSRAYVDLIKWPPFEMAVHDCYPRSTLRQKIFVNRLLLADVFGKEAGFAVTTGVTLGFMYGFRVLARTTPFLSSLLRKTLAGFMIVYAVNLLRRQIFGLSPSEKKAMQAKLDKAILTAPRNIDKENLQLYDETISSFEAELATLAPADPGRARIARKIDELSQRRAMIEERIKSAG